MKKPSIFLLTALSCYPFSLLAGDQDPYGFEQDLEAQLRYDKVSSESAQFEYRVRYRPSFNFSNAYSLHGFLATGDDFASSHNPLSTDKTDYFYLRRLFLRHSGDYGKVEFGSIPTYKGRVSSSGLSQDGWIKGLRLVKELGRNNALELVLGELNDTDPSDAISFAEKIDYVELEYSANMDEKLSYEFSVERMKRDNFVRTELRYEHNNESSSFAELVKKFDESKFKVVLGNEGDFRLSGVAIDYSLLYVFVSKEFGLRAELTEDFLATGHGIAGEVASTLFNDDIEIFLAVELIEKSSRFQVGLKWEL